MTRPALLGAVVIVAGIAVLYWLLLRALEVLLPALGAR